MLGHDRWVRSKVAKRLRARSGQPGVGIVRRPDPVPCATCAVGEWDMCRNGHYTERGIKDLARFGDGHSNRAGIRHEGRPGAGRPRRATGARPASRRRRGIMPTHRASARALGAENTACHRRRTNRAAGRDDGRSARSTASCPRSRPRAVLKEEKLVQASAVPFHTGRWASLE